MSTALRSFRRLRASVITIAALTVAGSAAAQDVDTAWLRIYNGPSNLSDVAYDVAINSSNEIYVTGTSQAPSGIFNPKDLIVIKYDSDGDTVWFRRFYDNGSSNQEGNFIRLLSDGSIVVAGYDNTVSIVIARYSSDGDTLWTNSYNGPSGLGATINDLAVDGNNNVYLTGSVWNGTDNDWGIASFRADGTFRWEKTYAGAGADFDAPTDMAIDASGDIYVCGFIADTGPDGVAFLIKYDSSGTALWERGFNGSPGLSDGASGVAIDGSQNILVAVTTQNAVLDNDIIVLKYKPDGDTVWTRRFIGPSAGGDIAYDVAVDDNDDIFVACLVQIAAQPAAATVMVIKYDTDGDTIWTKMLGPFLNAQDMAVSGDGGVVVTGTGVPGGIWPDWTMMKLSADGDSLWFRYLFNGLFPGGTQQPRSLALDNAGGVIVCGFIVGVTSGDLAVVKLIPDCLCPNQGDVAPLATSGDGVVNVLDVVAAIDHVFRSGPTLPTDQPACPNPRADIAPNSPNCGDGVINVLDVVGLIDHVFRSGPGPCDPCS